MKEILLILPQRKQILAVIYCEKQSNSMQKLLALTAYLRDPTILKKTGIKCNPEQIDSWSEGGKPELRMETGADGGFLLFDQTYRATIEFNGVAGDLRNLIALVLIWLRKNDPDRENDLEGDAQIVWDGDPYDDGSSDIIFELSFYEAVYFNQGSGTESITIDGLDYTLGAEAMDIAEDLEEPVQTAVGTQ